MRPYERRAKKAYPYYRLAKWDNRSFCWHDTKKAFATLYAARQAAVKPGTYRISEIGDVKRFQII